MKIGALTMITNPDYRQDPWREGIGQMLEVFDYVSVVCGREEDVEMVREAFPFEQRLHLTFSHWPQPAWSYEELPKHLNLGLDCLRATECDWAVRLDIDTAVHEKDRGALYAALGMALGHGKWIALVEKYQFFKPNRCHQKGKMPLCINLNTPVVYGFDFDHYTDLCQPIHWDGKQTAIMHGRDTGIPAGRRPDMKWAFHTRLHVWNYDYTFKTIERATELLYEFDRAHERFWGQGYSGRKGAEITPESALEDFLALSLGRWKNMHIVKKIEEHPLHYQASLASLSSPQWGYSLWDKIVQK